MMAQATPIAIAIIRVPSSGDMDHDLPLGVQGKAVELKALDLQFLAPSLFGFDDQFEGRRGGEFMRYWSYHRSQGDQGMIQQKPEGTLRVDLGERAQMRQGEMTVEHQFRPTAG